MAITLNKREKYSVYFAACFIGLIIIIQLIILPFIERGDRLEKSVQTKKNIVEKMKILKSEYMILEEKAEISEEYYAKREPGFTLFSFLDKLANETGVKDNIQYMKPSTSDDKTGQYKISLVEMKIQGITLDQLTKYLYKVETSKNMVSVKRLSISKQDRQETSIDSVLQLESIII